MRIWCLCAESRSRRFSMRATRVTRRTLVMLIGCMVRSTNAAATFTVCLVLHRWLFTLHSMPSWCILRYLSCTWAHRCWTSIRLSTLSEMHTLTTVVMHIVIEHVMIASLTHSILATLATPYATAIATHVAKLSSGISWSSTLQHTCLVVHHRPPIRCRVVLKVDLLSLMIALICHITTLSNAALHRHGLLRHRNIACLLWLKHAIIFV